MLTHAPQNSTISIPPDKFQSHPANFNPTQQISIPPRNRFIFRGSIKFQLVFIWAPPRRAVALTNGAENVDAKRERHADRVVRVQGALLRHEADPSSQRRGGAGLPRKSDASLFPLGESSRLYQHRILQPKHHFSAFFEIYKICNPLHRSDPPNSAKKCKIFADFPMVGSFAYRTSQPCAG